MNTLSFDETGSLVLKYTLTNNYEIDYDIKDYLEVAEFQERERHDSTVTFTLPKTDDKVKLAKISASVIKYFEKTLGERNLQIGEGVKNNLLDLEYEQDLYSEAINKGLEIKNKTVHEPIISKDFKRSLLDFQKGSVEHLLAVNNGANFSVPGSGKTTITYAAISTWLDDKTVEKIMVVGPTASFVPWEEEYEACFGRKPRSLRVKGERADFLEKLGDSYDLFVLHFQTANAKKMELMNFLRKYKTVLVVDESHNIKSPSQGKWASALIWLAPFAKRRILLSGTPMPNDARDLWTQITFLWPQNSPLGNQNVYNDYVKKRGLSQKDRNTLNALFSRIKKNDLHLPDPNFAAVRVDLGPQQREIYDIIAAKTLEEIESLEEHAHLHKFRIAKMIRLLQAASNPSLLYEMSHEFDVDSPLFDSPSELVSAEFGLKVDKLETEDLKKLSKYDKITKYSKLEIPSKLVEAARIARDLANRGEKVVIWSSFLLNMDIFKEQLLADLNPIVINGRVSKDPDDPINRDALINNFKNDQQYKILIATPASLGESVSLHKNLKGEPVCRHAIYLDRNFNGAQFMQSVDRIHRIGMDKNLEVTYHLLIGKNTIDEKIHERLWQKWEDMTKALNDPFLSRIDMDVFNVSDDEFENDYNSLIEHLRDLKRKQNAN